MRNLQTTDVFAAFRLISKIGVREEVIETAKKATEIKNKTDQMDLGFNLMFEILEKAVQENAENEIYIFVADLFGCKPDEVATMKPTKLFKNLLEIADIEEWKDFFGYVRALIMKK